MKVKLLAAAMMAAGVALSGCASPPGNAPTRQGPSAGGGATEAAPPAQVKTALATNAGLGTAADVNVQSYRGVVQLNGFVPTQEDIQRAVDAARKVEGVSRVDNNLQVKPKS